jgi:hypothetical protein
MHVEVGSQAAGLRKLGVASIMVVITHIEERRHPNGIP